MVPLDASSELKRFLGVERTSPEPSTGGTLFPDSIGFSLAQGSGFWWREGRSHTDVDQRSIPPDPAGLIHKKNLEK